MYAEVVDRAECNCSGSKTLGGYDFGGGWDLTLNTAAHGLLALDLFSRKIVGWAFAATLETKLVLDGLEMARRNRKPKASDGLLHHSDRGAQYASVEYRLALRAMDAACSMSRKRSRPSAILPVRWVLGSRQVRFGIKKGNCWDAAKPVRCCCRAKTNAVMESFFSTLKLELD